MGPRLGEVAAVQAGMAELGEGVEERAGVVATGDVASSSSAARAGAGEIGAREADVPQAALHAARSSPGRPQLRPSSSARW